MVASALASFKYLYLAKDIFIRERGREREKKILVYVCFGFYSKNMRLKFFTKFCKKKTVI